MARENEEFAYLGQGNSQQGGVTQRVKRVFRGSDDIIKDQRRDINGKLLGTQRAGERDTAEYIEGEKQGTRDERMKATIDTITANKDSSDTGRAMYALAVNQGLIRE